MTFLLAAVFLPLLLSPLAYVLGRKLGTNFATWFSFSILAISTILLMIPAMSLKSGSHEGYQESYQWSQFGNFGLRLDGLSLPFALIIYIKLPKLQMKFSESVLMAVTAPETKMTTRGKLITMPIEQPIASRRVSPTKIVIIGLLGLIHHSHK